MSYIPSYGYSNNSQTNNSQSSNNKRYGSKRSSKNAKNSNSSNSSSRSHNISKKTAIEIFEPEDEATQQWIFRHGYVDKNGRYVRPTCIQTNINERNKKNYNKTGRNQNSGNQNSHNQTGYNQNSRNQNSRNRQLENQNNLLEVINNANNNINTENVKSIIGGSFRYLQKSNYNRR